MQNNPNYKKSITWLWMYQPVFQKKQKCQNCPIGPTFPLLVTDIKIHFVALHLARRLHTPVVHY